MKKLLNPYSYGTDSISDQAFNPRVKISDFSPHSEPCPPAAIICSEFKAFIPDLLDLSVKITYHLTRLF